MVVCTKIKLGLVVVMIGSMYKQTTGRHHKEMEVAFKLRPNVDSVSLKPPDNFLRDAIDEFLKLFYF